MVMHLKNIVKAGGRIKCYVIFGKFVKKKLYAEYIIYTEMTIKIFRTW